MNWSCWLQIKGKNQSAYCQLLLYAAVEIQDKQDEKEQLIIFKLSEHWMEANLKESQLKPLHHAVNDFHTCKQKTKRRWRKVLTDLAVHLVQRMHTFYHTSAWKISRTFNLNFVDQISAISKDLMLISPLEYNWSTRNKGQWFYHRERTSTTS